MRMDQKPSAAAKLRQAAALVREVAALQNSTAHTCDKCGLSKAEDLEQARAAEHLLSAAKKLEGWSKTVGGKRLRRSPIDRSDPLWVEQEGDDRRQA